MLDKYDTEDIISYISILKKTRRSQKIPLSLLKKNRKEILTTIDQNIGNKDKSNSKLKKLNTIFPDKKSIKKGLNKDADVLKYQSYADTIYK